MPYTAPTIDEYLHKRMMPVEGVIPHLPGIEMYGDSIPAGMVGGDLFEYVNFQQRYDIDGRIRNALKLSEEFLESPLPRRRPRNSVDDHVEGLKSRPNYTPTQEREYRHARSLEQVRVAQDLRELHCMAGGLLLYEPGDGIIAATFRSHDETPIHDPRPLT